MIGNYKYIEVSYNQSSFLYIKCLECDSDFRKNVKTTLLFSHCSILPTKKENIDALSPQSSVREFELFFSPMLKLFVCLFSKSSISFLRSLNLPYDTY